MEKKCLLIFLFIILLSSFIAAVVDLDQVEEGIKKAEDIKDTLTDESERSEFLKEKWAETKLKLVLESIEKFFSLLNPLWVFLLGVSFSFSWSFALILLLTLALLIVLSRFAGVLGDNVIPLNYLNYYNILVPVLILILISLSKISLTLSKRILDLISGLDNLSFQVLSIIIVLVALIFAIIFSKEIKNMSTLARKEKRINKIEKNQEVQEREAKKEIKKLEKRFEKEELDEEEFERLVEEYKKLIPDYDIKKFLFNTKKMDYRT